MKRCSQCEKKKLETDFYKSTAANNGYQSECKACMNKRNKDYYIAHKKEIDARSKAYREANKEKVKAIHKAYRLAHKKKIAAYRKSYNLAHKKEAVEYSKAYRLAGGDSDKKYRLVHKKEIAEKQRAYRRRNPEEGRIFERRRRALKRGVHHESYKDSYIFERDGWVCQICGQKIDKKLKHPNPLSKSIDHIIPLNKGGDDAPTNVQAAHLRCNMRKYTKAGGQLRLIG